MLIKQGWAPLFYWKLFFKKTSSSSEILSRVTKTIVSVGQIRAFTRTFLSYPNDTTTLANLLLRKCCTVKLKWTFHTIYRLQYTYGRQHAKKKTKVFLNNPNSDWLLITLCIQQNSTITPKTPENVGGVIRKHFLFQEMGPFLFDHRAYKLSHWMVGMLVIFNRSLVVQVLSAANQVMNSSKQNVSFLLKKVRNYLKAL